jgi:hypothetical protein
MPTAWAWAAMGTKLVGLCLLGACSLGPVHVTGPDGGGSGVNPARNGGDGPAPFLNLPDGGLVDAGGDVAVVMGIVVYAHSADRLFRVDPDSLDVREVGVFHRLGGPGAVNVGGVTDIAIDRRGRIVGLTTAELLEIDALDAGCKTIAQLPSGPLFNGLSWVRSDDQLSEELVATGYDGSVYRIDPTTGASSLMGTLGASLRSSGDLVSVASYGTLATVTGSGGDMLVRMDPRTGHAVTIGAIGFDKVWGLGFWGNRVFGFTDLGQFLLVDPSTGAGRLQRALPGLRFWGAGVTTSAPVIQ